jgi:hypothetical protein
LKIDAFFALMRNNLTRVKNMKKDMDWKMNEFEMTCAQVILEEPEAIGVAYKGLDCGCALACGVSATGEPLGRMRYVSGQPLPVMGMQPVCLRCKMDDGLENRVVREGIYWPGAEHERPEFELRNRIGKSVFGDAYEED